MRREDIERLIPQRDPVRMVDRLEEAHGDEARTAFRIPADCLFLSDDGRLEEAGLVEHIAQSASALAGWRAREAGATDPPMGYIAEVRDFRCHHRPAAGDELRTVVRLGAEAEGVTLLHGETRTGDTLVAETQMKIFVQPGGRGRITG